MSYNGETADGEPMSGCQFRALNTPPRSDIQGQDVEMNENTVLKQILEREKKPPMGNITLLVVMFVVVLFINLMKGGGAFPSPLGIKCGSTSFWVANFINLAWIFVISLMARSYLLNQYRLKESCGYQ